MEWTEIAVKDVAAFQWSWMECVAVVCVQTNLRCCEQVMKRVEQDATEGLVHVVVLQFLSDVHQPETIGVVVVVDSRLAQVYEVWYAFPRCCRQTIDGVSMLSMKEACVEIQTGPGEVDYPFGSWKSSKDC